MRAICIVAAGAIALTAGLPAYADEADLVALLAAYQKSNGRLDTARLQRDFDKAQAQSSAKLATGGTGTTASAGSPPATPKPDVDGFKLYVRRNFADLWLMADPDNIPGLAQGAQFAFTHDGVADDDLWQAAGVVALAYNWIADSYDGPVLGASVAPYVQFNRLAHTGVKDQDVNTIVAGGVGELVLNMGPDIQYWRGRAALNSDQVNDTNSLTAALEWFPVVDNLCLNYPCSVFGTPFLYRFQPELELQYDNSFNNAEPVAFSGKSQALRIGPAFTVAFQPFGTEMPVLSQITGSLTYRWAYEVFSGEDFSWFDASLTYNLDKAGHLGLTGSYQHGSDEHTGDDVDKFMVSLTGKM